MIFPNQNELSLELKVIKILMLFPLWPSSIHLNNSCLRVLLVVGFSHTALHLQYDTMPITCAVCMDVDAVLLPGNIK